MMTMELRQDTDALCCPTERNQVLDLQANDLQAM